MFTVLTTIQIAAVLQGQSPLLLLPSELKYISLQILGHSATSSLTQKPNTIETVSIEEYSLALLPERMAINVTLAYKKT